jgi:hypothetical protein
MPMKPAWLPNILSLDGVWEKTLARLYAIFEQDFIINHCFFEDKPVWWDTNKYDDKYDEGFWHIITKDYQDIANRSPDFERARRLPWCAPTISNSYDPAVKCWDYREPNKKVRTYVWLVQWDYVIILEKQKRRIGIIAFIVTAYHVDGSSTRKKLAQKYEQRIIAV